MRFEISDFRCQTERGRFEEKDLRGETVRRQTIRLAERLVMFHPLTAGCMVAGDFSTALRSAPLEMTVASPDNQTVRLKRVLSKFFLLIMWKIVQIEFHSTG